MSHRVLCFCVVFALRVARRIRFVFNKLRDSATVSRRSGNGEVELRGEVEIYPYLETRRLPRSRRR